MVTPSRKLKICIRFMYIDSIHCIVANGKEVVLEGINWMRFRAGSMLYYQTHFANLSFNPLKELII